MKRYFKEHRVLYKGKNVPIKNVRYDRGMKTHVFVLDNDEGTLLSVNENIKNLTEVDMISVEINQFLNCREDEESTTIE